MPRIILFASGSGSNVENIANYFALNNGVEIACVLTNNPQAQVIERCKRLNISCLYFNKKAFSGSTTVLETVKALQPDLIVLAGFLWKIPEDFIRAFSNKIINIHPALLPKYGGKGMYGMKVHQAVKENGDNETGITVHFVNEHYDEGAIIKQAKVPLTGTETPDEIAQKVHQLEYEHFPKVIESLLNDKR